MEQPGTSHVIPSSGHGSLNHPSDCKSLCSTSRYFSHWTFTEIYKTVRKSFKSKTLKYVREHLKTINPEELTGKFLFSYFDCLKILNNYLIISTYFWDSYPYLFISTILDFLITQCVLRLLSPLA